MTPSDAVGKVDSARALFYEAPFSARIQSVDVARLTANDGDAGADVVIRTSYSGLSRGTERLVFEGRLPESEWRRMKAPFQQGEFPFPVKYGYSAVGLVEEGPDALLGRSMFALYPHQSLFALPEKHVIPLPESVPARRAILAANMETALNALWDSRTESGQTVTVIGAGLVGCLIGYLARRLAETEVTLIDINPARAAIAEALGLGFRLPADAPSGAGIVFHTTASEAGLRLALDIAGFEARIIEVSWFGDKQIALPLGGAFHSQRLQLISSQVGHIASPMRNRISHRGRLETAISLLDDPHLDSLITEDVRFDDLPAALPRLLAADAPGIATAVRY
jgi:NADPH:quinone reductase-like Zn-dependent oxidoreductase